MGWIYLIFVRWIHIICACLLVGATFFLVVVLSPATRELEPEVRELVYLRSRRRFKMIVHSTTLFLLASGIYNTIRNWPAYHANIPLTHALFGPHLLLGLLIFLVLFVLLARKQPTAGERTWMRIALVLMFLTTLIASALKYAREHPKTQADLQQVQVVR
jgi:uncharacterized membrane protein